jgi:hypothetical protein
LHSSRTAPQIVRKWPAASRAPEVKGACRLGAVFDVKKEIPVNTSYQHLRNVFLYGHQSMTNLLLPDDTCAYG